MDFYRRLEELNPREGHGLRPDIFDRFFKYGKRAPMFFLRMFARELGIIESAPVFLRNEDGLNEHFCALMEGRLILRILLKEFPTSVGFQERGTIMLEFLNELSTAHFDAIHLDRTPACKEGDSALKCTIRIMWQRRERWEKIEAEALRKTEADEEEE